jgi:hypothetical protein
MNFCRNDLEDYGFAEFVRISNLKQKGCGGIPKERGLYVVVRDDSQPVVYLERSIGGHHKGKDPTVSISELESSWVDGASVLYIGQTTRTLHARIGEFIEFGKGRPVGHAGGRYIWQLRNSDQLAVAWKSLPDTNPQREEARLIEQFKHRYGKRPFANLNDGRKSVADLIEL